MKIMFVYLFVCLLNLIQLHSQCPDPSGLDTSNVGPTSAILSWTSGGATNWQIEYDTAGFDQGTGYIINVESKPYQLINLFPETSYEFYVRDSCGVGSFSKWVGPDSFTTTDLFIDIGIGVTGISYSNSEWGDYDNDGDLDILFPPYSYTQIYRNDGNDNFTVVNVNMVSVQEGDRTWGDYDNDGDLDVAVTGRVASVKTSIIYRNDGGDIFTDINAGLVGVNWSNCAWGDYNNDGRLDLIVSGLDATDEPVAILYRNDGGDNFTDSKIDITPCVRGEIEWGDFDNDEFLDLLMIGLDYNGNENTEIYRNDGKGHFISINAGFQNSFRGEVDFGDYDNDGDLDVALCGQGTIGRIYRNNGDATFTDINAGLFSLSYSSIAWGDYDNDGDLDLLLCGYNAYGAGRKTYLYINAGNDVFTEVDSPVPPYSYGSIVWGDYDNDNDLDILVTGSEELGVFTKVYRNDILSTNTLPSTPTGIQTTVVNDGAVLSWDPAFDNETPSESVTYNIRMGSITGGYDVLSPMSDLTSGTRKLARQGNAGLDTNYYIQTLPIGNYFWSVQAIDGSFKGSSFSSEGSLEILPTINPLDNDFPPAQSGTMAWGDYNNDGYQDLILCGTYYDGVEIVKFTRIYKNNGDYTFDTINSQLPGVIYCSAAWGDYDNDSDLDILLSGNTGDSPDYNPITKIFRNDGGDVFTDINAGMTGVGFCDGKWGDYDNDGDLDVIVIGKSESEIYRNDGNDLFTDINSGLPSWYLTSLSLGDFDNDFDLDLLIGESSKTSIYRNEGNGNFVPYGDELPRLSEGTVSFGDFDNDNDLDILYVGSADYYNCVRIYSNEGDGIFNDIDAGFRGVSEAWGLWADFNNDGYSDILYAGRSGDFIGKLYLNDQDGEFTDARVDLIADYRSRVSCVDVENDGDIDIFITVYNDSCKLYRNNMNFPALTPSPPENLQSENLGMGVVLSWEPPSNVQNNESSLSYNIRLGSSSLSSDIISPMTLTPTSTKRLLSQMGNAQLNTGWRIDSLPVGDYYWSVQAITPSYKGGEWSSESSFTITQMRPFFSSDTVCLGDSTSFTDETIVTGTQIASWLWEFGDGNTSTLQHPKHLYEQPGNFDATLTVTDTAGVFLNKANPVYVLPRPVANFSISDICIGNMASVVNISDTDTLNIAGWLWDYGDGSTSTLQHPGPYGYLNTGIYEITLSVLAQNGCVDSIKNPISVAEYPVSNIAAGGNPEFCEGDSVKLSVPENSSYIYQWKVGGVPVADADSSVYLAYSSGNYTVSVTNQVAGCNSESLTPVSVLVSATPSPPLIQTNGPLTFCEGDSVVLSVTYNPDYTYQWKLNGGAVGTDSNTFTAKSSGTYSLDVSNASGCNVNAINEIDVTVNEIPTVPTVNISGETTFCEGNSVTLSVEDDPLIIYQWQNLSGNISGETDSSLTVTTPSTYWLNITDAAGCTGKTQEVEVNVNTVPDQPTISASGEIIFCQGDSVELSVTNNPDYSYAWKLNGGAIGIDTNRYVAKSSGNYILEVSNSTGCVALSSNSVNITVNDIPTIPSINLSGPTSFCAGDSVVISVTNNPAYTYQWKNEFGNITGSTTNEITVVETGTYNLEVSNSNNCSVETEPVIVTVSESPSIPVIVYSGSTTFCNGDSIQLSVTNNPLLNYQWKLSGGAIGIDTNIYVAKSSGNYTLEVSNLSGCVALASNSLDIVVNEIPTIPSINLSGPTSFCAGDSVVISVTNNPAYTYQWKNEFGNITGSTTNEITVVETGTYNLEVSNLNNCSIETEPVIVTVSESPSIPVIVYSGSTTFCNGDSIQLSVTNNPLLNYQWKLSGGAIGIDTNIYVAKSSGNYTLEVSNSTGCTAQSSNSVDVTVNETPDKPVVSLSGSTSFCEGDSLILSADEQTGVTYQWCNENGEILNANINQYVTYSSGNFYLDITNSSNCTNTSNTTNVTVTEMPLKPVIINTGYDIGDCPQERIITLSVDQATSQYNYQWQRNGVPIDGETGSSIEDYLNEGDYSVIANNNGCANESDIVGIYYDPELPEKPGIIATGPNVWYLACTNDEAQQYEWYYNNEIITGANDYLYVANQILGTYFVRIAEENGCFVASDAVTIPLTATGIDDVNPFANLKIYPNPTPGLFTIEMENNLIGELITRIFSRNAVEILNIKFDKSTQHFIAHVDLSGQGKGVYIISFTLDKYMAERKIIVE